MPFLPVEAEPEAAKKENPIKEEAKVAAPSHAEEKAPNATGKDGNQTTEKVNSRGSHHGVRTTCD